MKWMNLNTIVVVAVAVTVTVTIVDDGMYGDWKHAEVVSVHWHRARALQNPHFWHWCKYLLRLHNILLRMHRINSHCQNDSPSGAAPQYAPSTRAQFLINKHWIKLCGDFIATTNLTISPLWILYNCFLCGALATPAHRTLTSPNKWMNIVACQMCADISFWISSDRCTHVTFYHSRLWRRNHKISHVYFVPSLRHRLRLRRRRVQRHIFFNGVILQFFSFTKCFRRVLSFVALTWPMVFVFSQIFFFVFFWNNLLGTMSFYESCTFNIHIKYNLLLFVCSSTFVRLIPHMKISRRKCRMSWWSVDSRIHIHISCRIVIISPGAMHIICPHIFHRFAYIF